MGAVGEGGVRVESELDPRAVGRRFHRLGDQAIKGKGLVVSTGQKALIHIVAETVGGDAFDDEGIQAVEGPLYREGRPATFPRIRIDVGKMAKIGPFVWLAMHGKPGRRLSLATPGKQ